MTTFRMIRYKEKLLPWSETLSGLSGAVEVEMTKEEITSFHKPNDGQIEVQLNTEPDKKPGPGWVKNNRGNWAKKESVEEVLSAEVVIPVIEVKSEVQEIKEAIEFANELVKDDNIQPKTLAKKVKNVVKKKTKK
jgi:hypothetical protein